METNHTAFAPTVGHSYRNRRTGIVAQATRVFRSGPALVWEYDIVKGYSAGQKVQSVVHVGWIADYEEVTA